MNASNAHLYLPLVTALAEGRTIQTNFGGSADWVDAQELNFAEAARHYRIKPTPRRWFVLVSKETGLVIGAYLFKHPPTDSSERVEVQEVIP